MNSQEIILELYKTNKMNVITEYRTGSPAVNDLVDYRRHGTIKNYAFGRDIW